MAERDLTEEKKITVPLKYDKDSKTLTLYPGVTIRDIEDAPLDGIDDYTVVFSKNENTDATKVDTFEVSSDLLKTLGNKVQHMEVTNGLVFEYINSEGGDIWGNLSQLKTLKIENNVGLPCNVDGTGAFQNHPTLRAVEMALSAEGQLSDNFCRGTAVSSFMVHSAVVESEYGLKAGDNVLFGSLLESEKGLSTADWNKIHRSQICKTHKDNEYISEIGTFYDAIEEMKTVLSRDRFKAPETASCLYPILEEVAVRTGSYTKKSFAKALKEGKTEDIEKFETLIPQAKVVLNELKDDFKHDLLGAYLEKSYCKELVDNTLKSCSIQAQEDFKNALIDTEFRYKVRTSEIKRDMDGLEKLKRKLSAHIGIFENINEHSEIEGVLRDKGQENALEIVKLGIEGKTREKDYARALRQVSEAVSDVIDEKMLEVEKNPDSEEREREREKKDLLERKEKIKKIIRSISDYYGLSRSTEKRLAILEEFSHKHKKQEGTYVELPSKLWVGDNFLSCRKTEIHSATDPGKRLFNEEVNNFAKKTINAIYAACVVNKESFWQTGLHSILLAQDGEIDGKNLQYFLQLKDPIAGYNDVVKDKPELQVTKESLTNRGIEHRLKKLNKSDRQQTEEVFNFVFDMAKEPPKEYSEEKAKALDQKISSIVQMGDKALEELRKVLPSLDLTPDGHVLDLQQAFLMKDSDNVLVTAEGSKFGDNCLCFTNCRGIYVGHSKNEYRHFRKWAQNAYLKNKKNVAVLIKQRMGITMGKPGDKDAEQCGGLRDDIKASIVKLQSKMNGAPSITDQKGDKQKQTPKEEYLEELKNWQTLLETYEEYTASREIWEANNTEEKWLQNKSNALRDVSERIDHFEKLHATTKTKDFKTHEDVYTMEREALSDDNRAEYDKLIAERDAILKDPKKVVAGMHFCSEGKQMGNDKTMLVGGDINAGHNSFSNNPEVIELHKNKPETNIKEDVMQKNLYEQSDVFRGRMLMAKEKLKEVFDSRHFRYMRLEEACLDILVNLFKIIFNLTTWTARTLEREIRSAKTRSGVYNRNIDEAKEILLSSSGSGGQAFIERLTSKTSPASEYNAASRVVGRLTLSNILNSDSSSEEKLARIKKVANNRLASAKATKERVDVLNKRDQLNKAQLLDFYRQLGTWSREKGMAKTSKRLSVAISYSNGRSF